MTTATATPLAPPHRGAATRDLRIARVDGPTRVLGPGVRDVVWVQGCALRCRDCVVPESHAIDAGTPMTPERLAERLLAAGTAVDGVTLSGGEPFLQATGLVEVVRLLKTERPDWTFMSYSGYRLETLMRRGAASQRALVGELDLLVDGPFVRSLSGSLLWRGSRNQRLLALTTAGRTAVAGLADRSAGIEIAVDADGPRWTGVPPAGFRQSIDAALARLGLIADNEERRLP